MPDRPRVRSAQPIPRIESVSLPTVLAVNRRAAAAMLGISERLLWTWTHGGTIPHVRVGARVLYPVEELRKWLERESA